ncbi:MAG TPA: tyrosine--tRNA ligase, partial [Dehalococcoidia bacterium]|nr:tyrosine--tRNA ligase [Dehalococcoidia bacterium]
EVLTVSELTRLLASGERIQHYIGFEISGMIHIGSGLVVMAKIRDFMDAGVDCSVFLADWHTWINDKLGGQRDTIRRVAVNYFKEGMKASLLCFNRDPERLKFVLGTDLYHHNDDYWATVIDVSRNTSLARMQRSITILGRREGESVDFAKLIYPAMQAADIFAMGVKLAHAGIDQRKAHVIALDTALKLQVNALHNAAGEKIKPVAVHTHLALGLKKPPVWPPPAENRQDFWASMKMSKSDPASAIFIHDDPDVIRQKIRKAFCPPGEVEFNPILDWAKYLLFDEPGAALEIDRTPENGGPVHYQSFDELAAAYASGALHPMDLKAGVGEALIALLRPAREHFAQPGPRAMLEEMERLSLSR